MVDIYTFPSTRPDFIEMQFNSFRKYLQEDFRFTIFNNAVFADKPKRFRDKIDSECRRLGLAVIDVRDDSEIVAECEAIEDTCRMFTNGGYSNANVACAYPLAWAWKRVISKVAGPVCLLHSDVFLIHPISFSDLLNQNDLIYIPQFRDGIAGTYMWEAMAVMDVSKLPNPESVNWYCGKVNGVSTDVGGQTWWYLNRHPNLRSLHMKPVHVEFEPSADFSPADYETFWVGDEKIALHYRSGSNWNHRTPDYHERKTEWLRKRFDI